MTDAEDHAAYFAKLVNDRTRDVFKTGPTMLVGVPEDELVRRIDPRLALALAGYTPDRPAALLIAGATGVGKTVTAALIVRRVLARHPRWRITWARATDLARARRENRLGVGEAPLVEKAMRARLCIIDDAGLEPASDTTIADVLCVRYDRGVPTLVTTGLTSAELGQRYGGPLVRRMLEAWGERGRFVDLWEARS